MAESIRNYIPADLAGRPGMVEPTTGYPALPARGGWKECRLKLALDPAHVPRLLQHPMLGGVIGRPEVLSVYFDTPARKLQKAGFTLRIHRIGGRYLQTIKASPPDVFGHFGIGRREWEHEVHSDAPDRSLFAGTPLQEMILVGEIVPVFEARIERSTCRIDESGCGVEVSIDRGEIASGDRRLPITEIGIVSRGAGMRHVFDVAFSLCQALPLLPVLESRSKRGYDLADGRETARRKACAISLSAPLSVRTAFQAVGYECLRHLAANVPGLLDASDEEALHQMRVAIRRFRAAMSLFKHILQDPESGEVKRELQKAAVSLGEARNLEVFAAELARLIADNPHEPALANLSAELDARQKDAYRRARYVVSSASFHCALIRIAQWLAVGSWTSEDGLRRDALEQPISGLAAVEMTRRHKAVKRAVREFDACDAAALHKLRIRVKKLRYASEFFTSLFRHGKRRKAFLASLVDIQVSLGELNDLAVQYDLVLALARIADRRDNIGDHAGFAAGFFRGQQVFRRGQFRKTARRACARFPAMRPFWWEHHSP